MSQQPRGLSPKAPVNYTKPRPQPKTSQPLNLTSKSRNSYLATISRALLYNKLSRYTWFPCNTEEATPFNKCCAAPRLPTLSARPAKPRVLLQRRHCRSKALQRVTNAACRVSSVKLSTPARYASPLRNLTEYQHPGCIAYLYIYILFILNMPFVFPQNSVRLAKASLLLTKCRSAGLRNSQYERCSGKKER